MNPTSVVVTVDCPSCGYDKALMDVGRRHRLAAFTCESETCLHVWVGDVVEPDASEPETCGLGFGGGASCGLPSGHDEPCRTDTGAMTLTPILLSAIVIAVLCLATTAGRVWVTFVVAGALVVAAVVWVWRQARESRRG